MVKNIFRLLFRKINYFAGSVILTAGIFLAIALLSYNFSDPSFNRATNANIENLAGFYGAYIASPMIQLFGYGNIITVIVLLSWGVIYLFDKKVKFIIFRIIFYCGALASFCASLAMLKAREELEFARYGGYFGEVLKIYFLKYVPFSIFIATSLSLTIILSYISLGLSLDKWSKIFSFLSRFTYMIFKINKILFYAMNLIYGFAYRKIKGKKYTSDYIEKNKDQLSLTKKKIVKKAPEKTTRIEKVKSGEFKLPPLNILTENPDKNSKNNPVNASVLKKSAEDLTNVLDDFGVKGEVVDVHTGPVVTLYELEPAAGTKSSRVIGLADDISRSMKAHAARIAVIPGRNAIGIELPNKKREMIYLRELLESSQYKSGDALLPLVLGKDISGKPIIADLTRMPHLLVAGTTGSGKSVSINTMILSILYQLSPDECKLIMIDPKMLELSVYDGIPHLLTPVVTEPKKAIVALKWVVKEMEERYRMMSNLGVRGIAAYNSKIEEAKEKGIELFRNVQTGFDNATGRPVIEKVMIPMNNLPFIVVIVDEMADLMLVAGKDIETSIQRLSQMARAAGIHIIMATQRPSVDVITGVIKANFPTRISFSVTSRIDSRTILGEQGAEQLLGMGDMLYMGNGAKIVRVHGPYVADQEVRDVVDYLKSQREPEYIDNVTVDLEDSGEAGGDIPSGSAEDGGLYAKAVEIVARDRKASTSYIQRCLRIGYNRAASIIDQMEREGIVSQANHVGKREVLIPDSN